jgi:probable rRNA maturation factor
MNRVDISLEETAPPPWLDRAAPFVLAALKKLGKQNWDLSLLFCGDRRIRSLNSRYRGKDEATDVLSFTLGETGGGRYAAGDIVISLDSAAANAGYFGVEAGEELGRLLIHGILHLDGMDHGSNEESEPMLVLQEKLLGELAAEGHTVSGERR